MFTKDSMFKVSKKARISYLHLTKKITKILYRLNSKLLTKKINKIIVTCIWTPTKCDYIYNVCFENLKFIVDVKNRVIKDIQTFAENT